MGCGNNVVFFTRYIKLRFSLQLISDCRLPYNKASAIRGGIGEMLLRANCIRDRQCEKCDFETECIVQRTMYSKFDTKPEGVNMGDSIGYIIECEDYREEFVRGDELQFNLILFGKTIVYFNQYLQAIFALGRSGLGKEKAQFVISSVLNSVSEPILDGTNIYMQYYKVSRLCDYIDYRLKKIAKNPLDNVVIYATPTSIKHEGVICEDINLRATIKALQRRLYILACFENADITEAEKFYRSELPEPAVIRQETKHSYVRRYSSRKNEGMVFDGIMGRAELESIPEEILPVLLAGELIHVGKNTSFGFGRIMVR